MFTASPWHQLLPVEGVYDGVLARISDDLDHGTARDALRVGTKEKRYLVEAVDRLGELGAWKIFVADGDTTETASIWHCTTLNTLASQHSGSLAITFGINALALLPLHIAGNDDQVRHWSSRFLTGTKAAMGLSEWDFGSDLASNRTSATACERGFVLNGEKRPLNLATQAGILTVLARTSEAPPDSILGAGAGMSFFMLERDETVTALERIRTMPADSADISGFRLDNTQVPEAALIGEEGTGASVALQSLSMSRGGISAFPSGTTTQARRIASEYCYSRKLYGQPIIKLPPIARHLSQCLALELAVNCMSLKATAIANAFGPRAGYYSSIAKYICSVLGESCVEHGGSILAARSLIEGPYETVIRDSALYAVFDGTSHVVLDGLRHRVRRNIKSPAKVDKVYTTLSEAYRTPPQYIRTAAQTRGRILMAAPDQYAQALSELPGEVSLDALVAGAKWISQLVATAIEDGAFKDQLIAFDLSDAVCRIEAAIAVAEFADSKRRVARGLAGISGPMCTLTGITYEQAASIAIAHLVTDALSRSLTLAAQLVPTGISGECAHALDLASKMADSHRFEP